MAQFAQPPPRPEERRVIRFLDALENESKTVEKDIKENWESNLGWFRGQQWLVKNRAPLFMANKIGQIVRKKQAKLVEMKPQYKVQARRAGLQETNRILQKTIEAGWDEYNMQMQLEKLAGFLELYGCGFLYLPWDAHADYGQGDIVPRCIDPRYVHIDPAVSCAEDLDQASYIWMSSFMPTWEVQQRWPGRGMIVSPTDSSEAGTHLDQYLRRMFGAWKRGKSAVPEAIPRSEIRSYWFHDPSRGSDGAPLYPCGRHIIRGGDNVILADEPNPYYDERWPFVMIDGIWDPEHPWGQSEIQGLKRLQDSVNRIGHMFVENAILTGNTWVTSDSGALTPTTMQRLSNIGAVIIEKALGRSVEREAPPPMPPHMMEYIQIGMAMMDELSGLSDTTAAAQGRVEVRSDEQLEGLQQATEVLIRATARRIESGLERFGQRWIARIFQFYTRDRILMHLGPGMEWQTFEFERQKFLEEIQMAAKQLIVRNLEQGTAQKRADDVYAEATRQAWRHFTYRITPGSSMSSVRAARAQLHAQLATQGFISKTHVLDDLGFANPREEIDMATREMLLTGPPGAGLESNATPPMRRAV